jgi:hypothetical protein
LILGTGMEKLGLMVFQEKLYLKIIMDLRNNGRVFNLSPDINPYISYKLPRKHELRDIN